MTSNRTTPTTVEINGFALRCIRVLSGIGVRQLAEQIGKDRTYIAHIEAGRCKRVSPAAYNDILAALHIEDRRVLLSSPHATNAAEDVAA